MKKGLWLSALILVLSSKSLFADINTALLIHSDESNGNTSFLDSSLYHRTVVAGGNAQHSTAQAKFGQSSIAFDGNGDYLSINNTGWNMAQDFTVDFWIRLPSIPASGYTPQPIGQYPDVGGMGWYISVYNMNGVPYLWFYLTPASGAPAISMLALIPLQSWAHVALVRSGNVWAFYVNGTLMTSVIQSATVLTNAQPVRIGSVYGTSATYSLNGYLEEIHLTQGVALWTTTSFTPPTSPYVVVEPPTLSSATPSESQVQLQWTTAAGAVGYKVKHGAVSGAYTETVDVGNVTTHTVTNLTNGVARHFVVTAYGPDLLDSPVSNSLSATPHFATAPAVPVLNNALPSDTQITLQWAAAQRAYGYKIHYGATAGNYTQVLDVGNLLYAPVPSLLNEDTYHFAISAYNAAGESAVSNDLAAVPFKPGIWALKNNNLYFNTGNVGIGTKTPQTALAVNGAVTAKEVTVTSTGWADFVFAPGYALMPLLDLEQFVHSRQHLPGVPSATAIEKDGLPLSEMVTRQMQKIEELTLYLIELEKKNHALTKRLDSLESQNTHSNN